MSSMEKSIPFVRLEPRVATPTFTVMQFRLPSSIITATFAGFDLEGRFQIETSDYRRNSSEQKLFPNGPQFLSSMPA